jgi:hypothetical protein
MSTMIQRDWAVVHDIDGCLITDGGRFSPGTTIISKYSPVDADKTLNSIIRDKLLPEETLYKFIKLNGAKDISPKDIAMCGDYAYYDEHSIGKENLIDIKARVNDGITEELVDKAVSEAELTPGAEKYILWAKQSGAKQIVITDGWDQFAKYIVKKFGLDYGEGVKPIFLDKKFTGKVEKIDKESVAAKKLHEYGVGDRYVAAIDDSNTFISKYGLPIAFCPRKPETFGKYSNVVIINEPSYIPILNKTKEWHAAKKLK